MKPAPFAYVRPSTVEEAVSALAGAGDEARVLAGGQSLVPSMNFRLARPSVLVDVGRIAELQEIDVADGWLTVGACVRQLAAERSELVRDSCPLALQALRYVGHLQTRSRGTIGGSLAHGDPKAELPAVAVALDAEVVVRSVRGERTIAASELYDGPYMTTLEDDEILVRVRFPIVEGARTAFHEISRRHGDFALAGVAIAVTFDGRRVASARMAAIGTGEGAVRVPSAEAVLIGSVIDARTTAEAAAAAAAEVEDDGDADELDGRRALVSTLIRRALMEVAEA